MKFINAISFPDKLIRLFAMFIATMTLAACGGGDGFPGIHPLSTTASTSGVTLGTNATGTYTISGGVGGYTATTSNSAVATAALVDSTLTINGVSGGSATVVILDGAGTTLSVPVTVTPSRALFTTAPSALTVALGTASTYTIGGGTAPYTVTSSNTLVSVANLIGANTLSITGTSAGTAQVLVLDSTGATVNIGVTVVSDSTPLYVMAPDGGVTIGAPGTGVYTIGGGTPGYTAISSNPAVATVNVVGTTLTVTGVSGGAVTVAVYDAALGKVSLAVTVVAAAPLATTAPGSLVLDLSGAGSVSPVYEITGGTAPYTVTSGNASVVEVYTAAGGGKVAAGNLFFLTSKAAGTALVKILDSSNNELIISVTVAGPALALYTTAPPAITIAIGAAPSYAIGGGAAPYTVVSSNVIVATASVTTGTTLNIVGLAAGTANVVVTDAVDANQTIVVTVSSTATTPLVATPSAATANVGDVLNFIVSGGSPAYSFVINNPSIASVTSSGGTFRVTLLSAGSTTVAIVDALGQTATFTVTAAAPVVVPPPAPPTPPAPTPLALSPSALTVAETFATPIALNIQNGTGPYKAYTSDLVLSSVSVTGSTLTVGLGSQGNRCINTGTPYGTYAITITVVDAVGASATSVLTIHDNGGTCP